MKTSFGKSVLVLALAAALPLAAHAHRSWLLPSSSNADGKEPWVTIDAAVSENLFDFETNAVKLDDLVVAGPDGEKVTPENVFTGKLRSSFDLKLAKPGTYKAAIANESIMANYKLNGEAKRFRGSAEAFAKDVPANAEGLQKTLVVSRMETFVTAHKPNDTVLKPTGKGLELDPITHPTELRSGEKASFRFLLDGKPAAKLGFSLVPGGVKYRGVLKEIRLVTDDKGEASLTLPDAGMYWLTSSWPARPEVAEGAARPAPPERRASYSATLEILPQ